MRYEIIFHILYARHYNPFLIRNPSWILIIHRARILRKKPLGKTFLDFRKWVKSIQTVDYNGARMVHIQEVLPLHGSLIPRFSKWIQISKVWAIEKVTIWTLLLVWGKLLFHISNAGQKPAEGWFLSKWVYKFLPSQKLVHLSGYFFSFHIGGGQQQKSRAKSSKP